MQYKAILPEYYINQVSEERKNTQKKLRTTIKENLPKGFEEVIEYGMIGIAIFGRKIKI